MGAVPDLTISYQIDPQDCIVSVSDSWEVFARANDGAAVLPDKVLGRPLWDFIQDRSVRQLYRHLVAKARGGEPVEFDYRCDSPSQRRVFLMRIAPVMTERIEFLSRLLSSEPRPPQGLLDAQSPRSPAVLRICSWCLRVAVTSDEWVEMEAAVRRLKLLHAETLPALTHGICPRCLEEMVRLLPGLPTGG